MTPPAVAPIAFDDLKDAVGRDLGHSPWMVVDQKRVDLFADVADDHQWIHVDPTRAATGPFGGTVAHGYLTLSLAGARLGELLLVDDASSIINYGLDKVRFPAPLRAGARMRTHAAITAVDEVTGGYQVSATVTAEAEGVERPVCVAEARIRFLR